MIEKTRGRSMWQPLLEKYQTSGLSKQAFCEQEGVNISTFKGWCSKLLKEGSTDESSVNWLKVAVKGKTDATKDILRVELPNGVLLSVSMDSQDEHLHRLLRWVSAIR